MLERLHVFSCHCGALVAVKFGVRYSCVIRTPNVMIYSPALKLEQIKPR